MVVSKPHICVRVRQRELGSYVQRMHARYSRLRFRFIRSEMTVDMCAVPHRLGGEPLVSPSGHDGKRLMSERTFVRVIFTLVINR